MFGTDNILISKFVGVATTGLYSNYVMIRGFLNAVISSLFDAITPAMGNLNATEGEEERRTAFRRLDFFSAWLFGWMSICLLCLYDPFIGLWLGEGYLLPPGDGGADRGEFLRDQYAGAGGKHQERHGAVLGRAL